MRESSKAALGGIIAALSVSVMLLTYISPVLVYTVPVFAGMFLLVIVEEIGYQWGIGTFAAVSLLSVFMIADKEAAVFYTMLFGYYPILREFISGKIKNRLILFLIKLFVFNVSLFVAIAVCSYVFHIDYSEFSEGGKIMMAVYIIMMNAVLFLYDLLIAKFTLLYKNKLQKRIRKMFK